MRTPVAVIFGVGPGLGSSLARTCADAGMLVALATRNIEKLTALAIETGARTFACDVAEARQVAGVFDQVEAEMGATDLAIFNAAARYRAPLTELDCEKVSMAIIAGAVGGFFVGQAAARSMLPRERGTSVEQIKRFYAKHLPLSREKARNLQSFGDG